ncbi:MAG: pilus assembly protein N-terminal domain-containing protein [Candidatus Omnitrophica bacterium]|nr:pilus assembly protein N-terminal domain-containing protein [Candidatus Omnitrophota bacterium]
MAGIKLISYFRIFTYLFISIGVFLIQIPPIYASYLACEFFFEAGIKYYNAGRYDLALQEFKKALLANPDFTPAKEYINYLTTKQKSFIFSNNSEEPIKAFYPEDTVPLNNFSNTQKLSNRITGLGQLEVNSEYNFKQDTVSSQRVSSQKISPSKNQKDKSIDKEFPQKVETNNQEGITKKINFSLKDEEIQLERGKTAIVEVDEIQRFLLLNPNIILIKRINNNQISLFAKEYGSTVLHIWDQTNRYTIKIYVIPPKPTEPTYAEEIAQKQEKMRNFKIEYNVDWLSYYDGKNLSNLERSYYLYTHNLSISGETPYGLFSSKFILQQMENSLENPWSLSIALDNGIWQKFRGFSLRAVDFTPTLSNLSFGGAYLRGFQFYSPVKKNMFDYNIFWGQERASGLWSSFVLPQYNQERNIYLSGINFSFNPVLGQRYEFSSFFGYGKDRDKNLPKNTYDVKFQFEHQRKQLIWESAFDSKHFANLIDFGLTANYFKLHNQIRNISTSFFSLTGLGWRAGELGILSTLSLNPVSWLDIQTSLDIFRDRRYPNPSKTSKYNQDFFIDVTTYLNSQTRARVDYTFLNNPGRLTALVAHNIGVGLYHISKSIQRLNTYFTYRYQNYSYKNSSEIDYYNHKLLTGFRIGLIGQLYYFLSHETNWTKRIYSDEQAQPWAIETGFDFNSQLKTTPFFLTERLVYRNEEKTSSPICLLAGQDYLEWYQELSYSIKDELQTYLSSRLRWIWPEDKNKTKWAEWDIRAGVRYLWDTGFKWLPVGMIEGYVFKDIDADGIRDIEDPPISDIVIITSISQTRISNKNGYFLFPKVKGKSILVSIDPASIPTNYVLTTPEKQEVTVFQSQVSRVDFGLAIKTEIRGIVFEDVDEDGKFGSVDIPLSKVRIFITPDIQAVTDSSGLYLFNKIKAGFYRLTLDLSSLPTEYLPEVSIYKDITLEEGSTIVYNIPVKKVKEKAL